MASIFTKIINREIPAYIVEEDDQHIAFLDINPLKLGHTLVVPKKEVNSIFDLEDDAYQEMFLFAKKIAEKIKKNVKCTRIAISVVGLEVPHAHIHLIPIDTIGDVNFEKKRPTYKDYDFLTFLNTLKS